MLHLKYSVHCVLETSRPHHTLPLQLTAVREERDTAEDRRGNLYDRMQDEERRNANLRSRIEQLETRLSRFTEPPPVEYDSAGV